ncbi:MAG: PAS domain-containing sensor histidine kinase [Bacteroidales bacterium]|nr:PAS domain-containing sensor histidine kinase [Bacteroidales bacterium]
MYYNENEIDNGNLYINIIKLVSVYALSGVLIYGMMKLTQVFKINLKEIKSKTQELSHANTSLLHEILRSEKAHSLLEEEKIKYQTLFDQSLDAILILKNNCIVSCNKKASTLFDCENNDLIGINLFNFSQNLQEFNLDSKKLSETYINQALKGNPKIFEWQFKSRTNKNFYAEVSLFKITIKDVDHLQCLIIDISDRKEKEKVLEKYREHLEFQVNERTEALIQTNEELLQTNEKLNSINNLLIEEVKNRKDAQLKLEELNAMKDKLFSVIGHDLRNPFNNIINMSELLLNRTHLINSDKAVPYLQHINIGAQTGYNLLENLLQWARSQTGNIKINAEKIQVSEIIRNTLSFFLVSANNKNINIEILIDNSLYIYADLRMTETIFRNLISNAIKFTPEGGKIKISAEVEKDTIKINIQDSGIGISQEKIKLLFNPDSTISTKGTNGENGTGLGLLLCKEFIDKNNGKIIAYSDSNGATFSIILPQPYSVI